MPPPCQAKPQGTPKGACPRRSMRQRLMRAERANLRSTPPTARLAEGPLSLIPVRSSQRWDFVKGALWLRGLRTLDEVPPFGILNYPGKRGPGSQGACPLAEYEAAPGCGACGALLPGRVPALFLSPLRSSGFLLAQLPRLCHHASIRTRFAALAAGALWCS